MRSFNSSFVTEKNKRGTAPRNLLTFGFSTPVHIADYTVTPSGGSQHDGLVKSWGFIDSSVSQMPGRGILGRIEVPDFRVEIINSQSTRFSDNFTTADPPEGVVVTLYQWFVGTLYSEKEPIFVGVVRGQPEYDERTCRLTIRGIWCKYNKRIGEDLIITADDFASADPDDIGKMSSIGYGTLTNIPCRALKAGAMDKLRDDLTDSATSFYVSLSSKANFPSGTVVVQIDSEQIQGSYNQSTGQFTSCTRGYNSTTATAHDAGATVAEVLTEYVYDFLGHPAKSMGDVRVAGVKQVSGITKYTGQTGDELAGYEGRAVIKFTALPKVVKQVNLEADSSALTAPDTIDVSTGDHAHGGEEIISLEGGSEDYDYGSYWYMDSYGTPALPVFSLGFTSLPSGTPTYIRMVIRYSNDTSGTSFQFRYWYAGAGGYVFDIVNSSSGNVVQPLTTGWQVVPPGKTFIDIVDGKVDTAVYSGSSDWGKIWSVKVQIKYDPASSAATGVVKTGGVTVSGDVALTGNSSADTVIGGLVTCDGEGWQDDASGTITGTPNALITKPGHVFEHLLTNYTSFPSADIGSSFATSGTFYTANSYAFNLLINQPIMAEELLMRLAVQCRSRFFVSLIGKAELIVRQTGQSSGHAIPKKEIRRDSVSMQRSAADDIINYFNIRYDRDWTKKGLEAYQAVKPFSDATSISRYGQREPDRLRLFLFDAVTDAAMVTSVGNFWLDFLEIVRSMPKFAVFLDNMEIEPGDIIDVTHPLDNMSSFVCEILKIVHVLGSARKKVVDHLEILAVEN